MAEFTTPVWAKGLRSFFGLANYFRDHVRHHADDMERPIRDVLTKHDRSKKFQWSELAERSYREMQVAIHDCAKLYFLKDDPDAQIILRTDRSDYGYGAYLCQVDGEREYPILFMSRSFHGAELSWETQDKECGRYIQRLRSFSTYSIESISY